MSNLIETLSEEEVVVAVEYAKLAYELHCSVTGKKLPWEDLQELEQSAWMHVILGLRNTAQSVPPQHVALNEESNASLRAILRQYANQPMTSDSLQEARDLIYAWVKERVQNELGEDEDFDQLCSVEIVIDNNKLTPRFIGSPGRGEQLLRQLFT